MTSSAPARDDQAVPAATAAPAARSTSPTRPVLADDAVARVVPDLTRPLQSLLAPIVAGLQRDAALRAAEARPATEGTDATVAELLRDLAATGLLDVGVDEELARAHGYGPANQDRAAQTQARVPAAPTLAATVAALAEIWSVGASALAVQRFAIDVLVRSRRTPANDRLLKALRRGSVVGSVVAAGERPLRGRLRGDGSIVIEDGTVRIAGARPGSAVLVRVRLGARGPVVWVWTTFGTTGVTVRGRRAALSAELELHDVVVPAEAILDEMAPAEASLAA